MGAPILRSYRFRRERQSTWLELEQLMDRAEKAGVAKLDADQLFRLPVLYRSALSSLSVARAISLDKNVISYLSSLAARAYSFVYGTRHGLRQSAGGFFLGRYPALVWAMRGWVAVAMVTLLLGVWGGFGMTVRNPDTFYSLVSDEMAGGRSPLSTRAELLEVLKTSEPQQLDSLGAFASFLFTHNARIGLMCFTIGLAAGVPVVILVFANGLTLGAFAAIHAEQGLGFEFWAWLLPHGITELLAVCICAGAGINLGMALVFPGRRRRMDALVQQGRTAASIVLGTIPLFFAAALIEGFFRQLMLDDSIRSVVAVATAVVWIVYFTPVIDRWRAPWRVDPGGRR
jgi:uncharacterized membrane protein SpoIIM required for sporulation